MYHPLKPLPFIALAFLYSAQVQNFRKTVFKNASKATNSYCTWHTKSALADYETDENLPEVRYLDAGKTQVISLRSPMCKKEL